MKLMKSLLLGSAAGFAAVAGAQAADLPSKKAAPVEYVRVCSQFGAGFFYIPGSDTCLKVSGRVRAEARYNDGQLGVYTRSNNITTFRARGYLALDSFTATDWGPVRATTRVYVTKTSGSGATIDLDWAYIQFAGITAGRVATSFFEFAPMGGVSYVGGGILGRGSDYGAINAFAYTATFGGGFSATLAVEDGTERRVQIGSAAANFTAVAGTYAGHAMPDIVARLDYTGSWGSAALTGAVHQSRSLNLYNAGLTYGDTEYGFAIQGGVKVNLPMLAPGDALFFQAAYADGASSYTGWANASNGTWGAGNLGASNAYDVIYDVLGNGHTSKSWSVTGGLLHYWIPTLRQGVFASYGQIDQYGPWYDAAAFTVGTNLIWSPVKGLDIGAEVGWTKLTDTPLINGPVAPGAVVVGQKDDNWFGRIRFQRDF